MIQEIAKGVIVQSGSYMQEQRALVCGNEWCILIDAPQHFDEAEELKAEAEARTSRGVKMALLTHGHLDHTATLQVFPDVIPVAMWATRDYMQHKGQDELDRMKQDDEELKRVKQVLPVVTLAGEASIHDDTGRNLRCIPAPGHSDDSMIFLLEPERIVFGGDVLSPVVPPYFPDGNSMKLEETITRLANLDAEMLVPGHGPILRGEEISHEAGEAVRYLETLRRHVRDGLEQEKDAERLMDEIKWQDCSDKPVPPQEYLQYHSENIVNMAKEISEELTALRKTPSWRI